MKINQIKGVLQKNMDILKSQYGVKTIGVFGSFSRGDERGGSDIDMLVEFSKPVGFFKFIELEEFLGKLTGKKVDLVTKKALKPAIKNEILQEVSYV
ncbi:MAG: DNA polymerase beta protein [uncultured bacterium]|uniref:Polymerase beta domain protein region protein n=1 Tax=Candidatus Daviesbacteria bacterium GW2011_GWC2_40_12 TaxID=1618431 RepID=A0A0G0TWA1_9BACT|nr:MAG: DNA polymerase beta protein [uncultured bacterium]KKQ84575.1 MAG: polymerase beta domain protein region protein [Candidatus Daviesbacteria bacterium GW2011_GWF2_38_7]KKR16389.1 MAG: polymerase beta domain protein region protein [Candidatus Daviesbacteria bacterium GW2011_GWA2_39_33]KKR42237.1 MAG: polymerase beta domain protein region protein [Candidatus Daviesbacteria bacterium GW2011_GWC2_40_12]OGE21981.1 MAG: nucleotidyltransferase [Candidatus Daviesbacteria bacterium RIFCSPHIGHO2_01